MNERIARGGTIAQQKERYDWFQEFCGCLQDLGIDAYAEERVLEMYIAGYTPADAAGEEAWADDIDPYRFEEDDEVDEEKPCNRRT